jgi:hypothetical protein
MAGACEASKTYSRAEVSEWLELRMIIRDHGPHLTFLYVRYVRTLLAYKDAALRDSLVHKPPVMLPSEIAEAREAKRTNTRRRCWNSPGRTACTTVAVLVSRSWRWKESLESLTATHSTNVKADTRTKLSRLLQARAGLED